MIRSILLVLLFASLTGSPLMADGNDAIDSIDAAMQRYVDDGQLSGAVTVVNYGGKTIHYGKVGDADLASKRPMDSDTMFWIASMTKPIAATAIHILQDEGKLSIEDPVSKYIPEFADVRLANDQALKSPLTIRHLITHTSGVDRGHMPSPPDQRPLKQHAEEMASRPLAFEPGSRWEYSAGLHVLGRVVEVVSEMPFEDFLDARIFKPLGMHDTTFNLNDEQAKRLATLYRIDKKTEALVPAKNQYVSIQPGARQHPSPSGGLFSTGGDVMKFYQMILSGGASGDKRIVSGEAIEAMTTIQTGELKTGWTPGNGWGLGWCVIRKPQGITGMLSPGSYGHGGVYGTQVWVDPKLNAVFLLMIQRSDLGNADGSQIRKVFQQAAVDEIR